MPITLKFKFQSYNASNLLPVVPMYDNAGNLNAIFFASTSVQQGLLGSNQWGKFSIFPDRPLTNQNLIDRCYSHQWLPHVQELLRRLCLEQFIILEHDAHLVRY